jgi:hypothetical protein
MKKYNKKIILYILIMKIKKFENNIYPDSKFPISCIVKDSNDLGICKVISINFENETVKLSNGYIRTNLDLNSYIFEFIPDIFSISKYNL